jgi:hypothetical protein
MRIAEAPAAAMRLPNPLPMARLARPRRTRSEPMIRKRTRQKEDWVGNVRFGVALPSLHQIPRPSSINGTAVVRYEPMLPPVDSPNAIFTTPRRTRTAPAIRPSIDLEKTGRELVGLTKAPIDSSPIET